MDGKNSDTLCTLLLVLFIILKVYGIINWSWLWVLAPLWIPWCIAIVCAIIWALV